MISVHDDRTLPPTDLIMSYEQPRHPDMTVQHMNLASGCLVYRWFNSIYVLEVIYKYRYEITVMMSSPYDGLNESEWENKTRELIDEHPLDPDYRPYA